MELIPCPACGHSVSPRAAMCPKCGDPIVSSVAVDPASDSQNKTATIATDRPVSPPAAADRPAVEKPSPVIVILMLLVVLGTGGFFLWGEHRAKIAKTEQETTEADLKTATPDVMIGSVAFNEANSLDVASLRTSFPLGTRWDFYQWFGSSQLQGRLSTRSFAPFTVFVGSRPLPCIQMTLGFGEPFYYSLWAVAKNGGLYCLTPGRGYYRINDPSGNTVPVTSGEPQLIMPKEPVDGFQMGTWSSGLGSGSSRTIISRDTLNPAGYTGCVHVRSTGMSPLGISVIVDEYWQINFGLAMQTETYPEHARHNGSVVRGETSPSSK